MLRWRIRHVVLYFHQLLLLRHVQICVYCIQRCICISTYLYDCVPRKFWVRSSPLSVEDMNILSESSPVLYGLDWTVNPADWSTPFHSLAQVTYRAPLPCTAEQTPSSVSQHAARWSSAAPNTGYVDTRDTWTREIRGQTVPGSVEGGGTATDGSETTAVRCPTHGRPGHRCWSGTKADVSGLPAAGRRRTSHWQPIIWK